MNSQAPRVITACTEKPSCCRRRTHSARYAQCDVHGQFCGALFPPLAVFILVDGGGFGEVILEQALVELFARQARGLLGSWIFQERRRAGHELARAPRRQYHVGKLALRSLCLHGHVSLSLQTMPVTLPPGPFAAPPSSALPARPTALR